MIAEELRRLGWSEGDLVSRRKNGAIAVLRRETALLIKAIAERVQLGAANTANAR